METVNILLRQDACQNGGFIQVLWHWQLNQDTADLGIRIERIDDLEQFGLRCIRA